MSALIVIIGISVLILVHELGHFLAAKFFNVRVEEFGIGFPPKLFSKQVGETRYSINLLPLGGFVRLFGESPIEPVQESEKSRSFSHQSAWRRTVIVTAGVAMNFLLGWLIISGLFFFGGSQPIAITSVLPDTPAAAVDLREGDRVVEFNNAENFINFVNENRGREINLKIQRGEKELIFAVTPRVEVPKGEGALGIGISGVGFPKLGFFASVWEGFSISWSIVAAIFMVLFNLIIGIFSGSIVLGNFVGPVGIFQIAAQAGQLGFSFLFNLVALISLNLLVLNILPLPALDGGRLLFILIEKIKGSPISPQKESLINAVGFIFLLLLMVAITVKDIIYLF